MNKQVKSEGAEIPKNLNRFLGYIWTIEKKWKRAYFSNLTEKKTLSNTLAKQIVQKALEKVEPLPPAEEIKTYHTLILTHLNALSINHLNSLKHIFKNYPTKIQQLILTHRKDPKKVAETLLHISTERV